MLKKSDVAYWCEHPVTISMIDYLVADKAQLEVDLNNYVYSTDSISDVKRGILIGKIQAAEEFIQLKTKMMDLSEEYDNEVTQDEVQSSGAQSPVKS